jgi:hypothetical protein
MMTGASSLTLEPQLPIGLAGRGGAPRIGNYVHDTLEVNTVVFDDGKKCIAIVSMDTLFCCNDFKELVLAHLRGAKIGGLFLVASHTHNAPSLDRTKPLLGQVDEIYYDMAAGRVARSVADALEELKPVHRVDEGTSDVMANNRRRRRSLRIRTSWPFASWETCLVPSVDIDVPHSLRVLVARNSDGAPMWCLWTWPCHATAYPVGHHISAEFPGDVRKFLRKELVSPGLPVVFFPGASGDLRVDVAPEPVSLSRRLMTPLARPFADCNSQNYELLIGKLCRGMERALKKPNAREMGQSIVVHSTAISLRQMMTRSTHPGSVEWHKISIGEFNLLLVGAELCSSWLPLLESFFNKGTWKSGYCNDVPCYLPTQQQVREGGYEATGFLGSFGVDGAFADDMQVLVLEAIGKLQGDQIVPP